MDGNSTPDKPAIANEHSATLTVLTPEQKEIIELVRRPKLSIEYMDAPTKRRLDAVMRQLYYERDLSCTDISRIIGNKTSGYVSWLLKQLGIPSKDFEQARLKAIKEKRRKYERKPFDGTDEDKAYLLGLKHGDLSTYQPWNAVVRVSTSTTHPAMAELFTQLFSPYGHVYQYPRHKYDTHTYEWNLQVILDESFHFLLLDPKTVWEWVSQRERTSYSYLAGIWDAEGSVEICENRKVISIRLPIYNTNVGLLKFVVRKLRSFGYTPRGLQLNKREGSRTSKWGIPHRKNYWTVRLLNLDQSQSLLRKLPLRHREKVAMKELALSLRRGDHWKDVSGRVKALRNSFESETQRFLQLAMEEFAKRHKSKTETIMHHASTSTCSDQVRNGRGAAMELTTALEGTVESPAVLCVLQKNAERRGWRRGRKRKGERDHVGMAMHDRLSCIFSWLGVAELPCIVLWEGCKARNIIQVLVHESIHHALFWLEGYVNEDDGFDKICFSLEQQRRVGI